MDDDSFLYGPVDCGEGSLTHSSVEVDVIMRLEILENELMLEAL